MQCTVNTCDQQHLAHGYCNKHYKRWRKYGDALRLVPRGAQPKHKQVHRECEHECIYCGQHAEEWPLPA